MAENSELEKVVEDTREAVEAAVAETEEVAESEYSETEQQAIEHGWTPEGVEGKRNLTAEEFMDRQPLYDDIRALKKQYRKLNDGYEALQEHHKHVKESERAKLVQQLKAAKKVALEQDNYDAIVEIDDRIAEAKTTPEEASNVAFEDWIDKNDWYHQDSDMKQFADMLGTGYFQQNPNKNVSEVYDYVSKEVKKRFPDKFSNQNRIKPNPVEGASKGSRTAPKSKYTAKDLPDDARQMMKTIVRTGGITEEQYLKEYFSS